MRRARRYAAIVLLVLVAVASAAIGVVLLDPGLVVSRVAPAVERATGRRLTVEAITPELGGVALRGVTLDGGDPDAAPQTITARAARARIAWWPLLSGRVEVRAVDVQDAAAVFGTDAQGALHLRFGPAAKAPEPGAAPAKTPARAVPAIEAVTMERATFTLQNRRAGTEERVDVLALSLRMAADGAAALSAAGSLRAMPFDVTGTLADGGAVKLAVVTGADRVAFEGTLGGGTPGGGVRGTIALTLPDPAVVTPLLGEVSLPPVELSGHVEGTQAGGRFDLQGMAYGSHVHAAGDVVAGPRPSVRAEVTADRLDPATWIPRTHTAVAAPLAESAQPVPPAEPPGRAARPAPDLASLKGFDADIMLSAGVVEPGIKDFSAHLVLAGGVLTAEPIAATYAGVTASGRITLDANATPPRLSARLPGVRVPASALGPYVPLLRGATGTADLHADVRAAGLDAAAMEASLSGRLGVAMVDGALAPAALAPILAAAKLPPGVMGALPGALTALRCLAARADFSDGVGRLDPLVAEAAALRLTGGGRVDLRNRTLALRLHPLLRAAGFGISVPVEVSGPIAAPLVRPDIAPGPVAGADALGREAAGLVIGALQAAGGGEDPCPAALAAARFLAAPGSAPQAAPPAPLPPVKLPKPADLLRGLLR